MLGQIDSGSSQQCALGYGSCASGWTARGALPAAQVSLTPEDGTHSVALSPCGGYLLDTYSKVDTPPVVVLRSAGKGAARAKQGGV